GMDCADCALKIEKGVRQLAGVERVELNFSTALLTIEGQVSKQAVQKRVEQLGYRLLEDSLQAGQSGKMEAFLPGLFRYLLTSRETRLALLGGGLIAVSFLLAAFGWQGWTLTVLQLAALALAGYPVARSAVMNLWINRDFNMNFLMTVAAIGAVVIGEYPEAASLIFLFAIAEALEGYSTERARRSIRHLTELAPQTALRMSERGEERIPVENLRIGDRVIIPAGERIPTDGVVRSGHGAVNQAPITGESLPVEKSPGDEVFAGSINGSTVLEVEVTRLAADNTLNRIIRLVEEAQASKAPAQRFVDQFARYYTPAMLVLAVLVAVIPPLFFGQPLLNLPDGTRGWLYRGLALLVIGCPCALVISTPVTVVSAIAAGAQKGVLFKGGAFLEALSRVRAVAFDKTGTLTRGTPVVTTYRAVDCADGGDCEKCQDVLALACALERRSKHPLAQAVVQAAVERGLENRYPPAERVSALNGIGLQGKINGQTATIGSHRLFEIEHPHSDELCRWVESAESLGQTTMLVCDGERVRGYLAVSDSLRPESGQVILRLRHMGVEPVMLTGDNPAAAQAVGGKVGLQQIHAGLLPDDKTRLIQELRTRYPAVAMVGDGINDTPALAAATVGIAMGGAASAQAMETADVVLMSEGLNRLPFAMRLARLAQRIIRQNIAFSLITKAIFILLALAGWTTMWMAVLADMGVSLLVTFNGMRPLALRDENDRAQG
ncbi:MAG: heavy metal translocating P-type ATPase, partial [Bellilinea sp.]|nr:heavy metal translocating P-type ATPase [Bellilinea sp.]